MSLRTTGTSGGTPADVRHLRGVCSARVLADSVSPVGRRLVTLECRYPRIIHSELLTHCALARSSASSRAIPVERMLEQIERDPFVPEHLGKNQRGMSALEQLGPEQRELAQHEWLLAQQDAVRHARKMAALGGHKQVVNRVTEPWMFITVIVSATEWTNFDGLRDHEAAEPHMQDLARAIIAAREASAPRVLSEGEWHTPLFPIDDIDQYDAEELVGSPSGLSYEEIVQRVSTARCARVSYLTHDGRRDLREDLALYDKLMIQRPLHASPAEHVAQAMGWPEWWLLGDLGEYGAISAIDFQRLHGVDPFSVDELVELYGLWRSDEVLRTEHWDDYLRLSTLLSELRSGKFYGWTQLRKTLPFEHIGGYRP